MRALEVTNRLLNLSYSSSFIVFIFLLIKIKAIPDFNVFLYFPLISAFGIYWASWFLKYPIKLNIHISIISFLLTLFLFELFVEVTGLFVPKGLDEIRNEGIAKLEVGFDRRTKFQVIMDYRNNQDEAYPSIHPHNDFLDSLEILQNEVPFILAGVSKVHTILCNENGYYAEYISDRYGFNNPDDLLDKQVDVALIGDSFTQGSCVNSQDNIRANLGILEQGNILNLGMGGNGPLIELATLIEYASTYKPHRVYWIFTEGNDLSDLREELKNKVLVNYLKPNFTQKLIQRQSEIDFFLKKYINKRIHEYDYQEPSDKGFWNVSLKSIIFIRHLRYQLGFFNSKTNQPFNEFKAVLKRAQEIVKSWDGELIFVYLPSYALKPSQRDPGLEHIYINVLKITESLELPIIDLNKKFWTQEDPMQYYPFRLPGHFTPEGYAWVAKEIVEYLQQSDAL